MLSFIRNHKIGAGVSGVAVVAGLAWLAFGFFGVHTLFVDDVVDEGGPVFDAAPAVVAEDAATPAAATSVDEAADTTDAAAPIATSEVTTETTPAADSEATVTTTPETTTPATAPEPTPTTTEAATPEIVTEFVGDFVSEAHPTEGVATVLGNGTGQRFLRLENFQTDNGPDLNVYLFNSDRSDYIDLGDLKGNIGDQNYEIPADVDLSVHSEVSIWCVRFSSGFGSADLMAA